MTGPDLVRLATEERTELADLAAGLTPEQWEQPTLCTEWSVRQVLAHIVSYDSLSFGQTMRRMARSGFSINRANRVRMAELEALPAEEVLAEFRRLLRPRGFTAVMFGGAIALTDCLIHHQDVRRGLGLPREVPAERLLPVLRFSPRALALPSRKDVDGLRLEATDVAWSRGSGPLVRGPGEALIMAIAGREAALPDLTGPGVAVLAERLGRRHAA